MRCNNCGLEVKSFRGTDHSPVTCMREQERQRCYRGEPCPVCHRVGLHHAACSLWEHFRTQGVT